MQTKLKQNTGRTCTRTQHSYTHVSQVVELHWCIIFFLTPSSINRWFSDPNTCRNFIGNHWFAPNNIRLIFRYDYLISNVLITHCGIVMRDSRFKNFIGITPTDAIYGNIDLSQVMACCPAAPSHHLHQCWLLISKVLFFILPFYYTTLILSCCEVLF